MPCTLPCQIIANAVHYDFTQNHCQCCALWLRQKPLPLLCIVFIKNHCYALWLHQKALLCIMMSSKITAMHSEQFWHRPHMSVNSTHNTFITLSNVTFKNESCSTDVTPMHVGLLHHWNYFNIWHSKSSVTTPMEETSPVNVLQEVK